MEQFISIELNVNEMIHILFCIQKVFLEKNVRNLFECQYWFDNVYTLQLFNKLLGTRYKPVLSVQISNGN